MIGRDDPKSNFCFGNSNNFTYHNIMASCYSVDNVMS